MVLGDHRRGQLLVAVAALAWSSAGVLQRELDIGLGAQIAGRALFAALALAGFVAWSKRRGTLQAFLRIDRAGLLFAVTTAIASGGFIVALEHTTVANVLFMQALAPFGAAFLAWLFLHESASRRAWLAMGVALLGIGLMVGGPGGSGLFATAVAATMTIGFAASAVIARHRRDISMVPATCLSQVIVLVVAAPFARPGSANANDVGLLVALGVGQMALGLAFFAAGARLLPAAEVALIALIEVVLGPLWVWLALREEPSVTALIGGVIVLLAVFVQVTGPRARNADTATAARGLAAGPRPRVVRYPNRP